MCFAVPEKEVRAVAAALESRFRQALDAGRLSQVVCFSTSVPADSISQNPVIVEFNSSMRTKKSSKRMLEIYLSKEIVNMFLFLGFEHVTDPFFI